MKKIGRVAGLALVAALVFAGCKPDADDSAEVKTVSASSVVTEAKSADIEISADAEAVEDKETFEAEVLPAIEENLAQAMSSIIPAGGSSSTKFFRAAITAEDLEKSFDELEKQIESISKNPSKMMDDKGNISYKLDWKAPTGTFTDDELEGVELNIKALSLKADVSGSIDSTTANVKLKASASTKAEGSAAVNLKKVAGISEIPYVKANAAASASGKVNASNIAISSTELGSDASISGNVKASASYSVAALFDVNDYAGVIKIDFSAEAKETISEEMIKKYTPIFTKLSMGGKLSQKNFEDLPVDVSLKVIVYDLEGNKMFSYLEVNSLYEAYTELSKLGLLD